MFIELTEVLACPACLGREGEPPAQGLVAVVDRLHGRHVLHGYLGCASCERRYPVRGGVVDFAAESAPSAALPPAELRASGADAERVVRIAALLGLAEEAAGAVALDVGLARAAEPLSALAPGLQLLGLVDRMPAAGPDSASSGPAADATPSGPAADAEREGAAGGHAAAVSYARVARPGPLPVASGRLRGVVLEGGGRERLREAVRALGPGGRLVVLRPGEAAREAAQGLPIRVLALEERALVAVRG